MSVTLFTELKNIGIDEELAAKVSASLDPDHNASKKDVLIMQEAILQHQVRSDQKMADIKAESDARYYQQKAETDARYYELKVENSKAYAELKTEIHTTINRQYLVTFGSALLTITSVLAVNWYFNV
ncbi:hypothetical protein [Endozoicomonas sp. SESOKO3]|uniref:hypothetical protein n=1 Tax=Endozoicomonas sp. SESOKO3 TaxID=2828744 RepID=UPI0021477954|nr:hypothetical protein [Endozoicomonas sp. SESOKO3]